MPDRKVTLSGITIGNRRPMMLIAGPCALENERLVMTVARQLQRLKRHLPCVLKVSYDKANRMSRRSFRGPGLEAGLAVMTKIKQATGLPLLTDVHCIAEIDRVKDIVDIIQIPAFLCRQTNLVLAAAETGRVINIKKGQFLAPEAMVHIIEKIESTGNRRILLTERGVSFGYGDLVVDYRSIEIMKRTGYPVIFDATHSVQQPARGAGTSGGVREFIRPLCRAAVAVGVAGLYLEVHPRPGRALCDGSNMLALSDLDRLVKEMLGLDALKPGWYPALPGRKK